MLEERNRPFLVRIDKDEAAGAKEGRVIGVDVLVLGEENLALVLVLVYFDEEQVTTGFPLFQAL